MGKKGFDNNILNFLYKVQNKLLRKIRACLIAVF